MKPERRRPMFTRAVRGEGAPKIPMPTGQQLVEGIQRTFEKDVLPGLKENEAWRQRSRGGNWKAGPR